MTEAGEQQNANTATSDPVDSTTSSSAKSDSLFESNLSTDVQKSAESSMESPISTIKTTSTTTSESEKPANEDPVTTKTTTTSEGPASTSSSNPIDEEKLGATMITIRALVTSKEAGAIIGKSGKNVADLRDQTGVKAGVSKPVPGVQDRVLTITGTLDGVTKAYSIAAQTLVENPPNLPYVHALSPPAPPGVATIRLLIPHQQMGSVIGRQGLKIKAIQETSHVRMVASKEMLPQSTERVVEIQGIPESIRSAVLEVGKCLLDDWERAAGSILYIPQPRGGSTGGGDRDGLGRGSNYLGSSNIGSGHGSTGSSGGAGFAGNSGSNSNFNSNNNGYGGRYRSSHQNYNSNSNNGSNGHHHSSNSEAPAGDGEDDGVQEISIPADMVGCIIGKGGTKIQEIRRESGARISIAKQAIDETGERLFSIRGTPQANEKALYLLYEQLELEKNRRSEEN